MAALAAARHGEAKMNPGEQRAHDTYNAMTIPRPDGILDGEPALFSPAPGSMGVAFAVTAPAAGFAEVADNPEMKDSARFTQDGIPLPETDNRAMRIRMTGLKPGTRYWYRTGAAKLVHPVGYWTKPSEIVWGSVHSFTTPGENAPSHFGMMTDTHAYYGQMARITAKYKELGIPLMVWNGDVPYNMLNTKEDIVREFLTVPENAGYAAGTPIALNRGNHDFRGDAARRLGDILPVRPVFEHRKRSHLALEWNYAFRMGEIALIGLDTGEDKPDFHPANGGGMTRFSQYRRLQADWLKDQFERPEIAKAPYVVACAHIPLVETWPGANPGDRLEDFAIWQKECADLWGPVLSANGVQLVLSGHQHAYRFDPAKDGRSWAEIVGGGPGHQTLVECKAENGRLRATIYNTDNGTVAGEHFFKPRRFGPTY